MQLRLRRWTWSAVRVGGRCRLTRRPVSLLGLCLDGCVAFDASTYTSTDDSAYTSTDGSTYSSTGASTDTSTDTSTDVELRRQHRHQH